MKNILPIICTVIVLQACNNTKAPEKDLSIIPINRDTSKNIIAVANTGAANQTTTSIMPGTNTVQPTTATTIQPTITTNMQNNAAVASGINPAHGLPGHDCSKPVGAPLTTTATNTREAVKPQPINNAMATKAVANAVTASNAKGLNPAHGQPGHDCAVAVGAPLNQAKTKPVTVNNTTNTAVPAMQNVPVPLNTENAATSNSTAKLNPAHGQPGHNCAVAVGQPLP